MVELDEMPPQPVLSAGALGNEIVAVIGDQPDLHRLLVQKRRRKALHAVLDDRARDRERIDLVRLAGLTLPTPRRAHPVRRHPHHSLASGDQSLLKPPRDMPAVLNCPHPLVIEPARPLHRREMPRFVSLDLPMTANPTRCVVDRRQRVRALMRVRPDHDHMHRPFVWLNHR
jgi:riboflavin biosynthesis pyrimidine reductase